uniref:Cathepsin propeptide inhibitor domain-containing protein n=1 Tax=Acrobeloides nanus TaxID=290746 RepID=A0A914CEM2_9BILA
MLSHTLVFLCLVGLTYQYGLGNLGSSVGSVVDFTQEFNNFINMAESTKTTLKNKLDSKFSSKTCRMCFNSKKKAEELRHLVRQITRFEDVRLQYADIIAGACTPSAVKLYKKQIFNCFYVTQLHLFDQKLYMRFCRSNSYTSAPCATFERFFGWNSLLALVGMFNIL